MAQSIATQGIKIFFVDLVGGLFGFPFWWYSKGLMKWSRAVLNFFNGYRQYLGVGVWIKNIFVPMYGSYDIPGRIISFFVRLGMIVFRFVALIFLSIFSILLFLIYLVVPVIVVYMILYNLFEGVL